MLPTELVIHLLSFFDADEDQETLRACALVHSSWRQAAQEILFEKLTLTSTNHRHERYEEISGKAIGSYNRLIDCVTSNSLLSTYIHNVSLRHFSSIGMRFVHRPRLVQAGFGEEQAAKDAVSRLLKKMTNVRTFKLLQFGDEDGHRFDEALVHMFHLPTLTRLEISFASFTSIGYLLRLLILAKNLKHISFSSVGFDRRIGLSAEQSLEIAKPRSIHPTSLHFSLFPLDQITPFLSAPYCPIDFSALQTLKLHRAKLFDYDTTAQLLSIVGQNLQELELHGPDRLVEGKDNLHLGHTPNLQSLTLINLRQSVSHSPVPWIQSLFPLSVAGNLPITPHLRNISLEVVVDCPSSILRAVGLALWTQWRGIDALFSSSTSSLLEFPALDNAHMIISTPNEALEPDLIGVVEDQFLELGKQGKFSLETTYWEMATSTALMRIPALVA
ncbi:hypothetical protein V5O48_012781 [Marasmius crinis-equi]|uniref:F-box domain-containing protein n=1 Tax=Marasmius crinis-equi TaxID=585013 RepID=A0ABR3F1W9_9AGAR